MSDFSISSVSTVDLMAECSKLGISSKIANDPTKLQNYFDKNSSIFDEFQKDLTPQKTQSAVGGSQQQGNNKQQLDAVA